jgi:hypothetical protein
MAIDGTPNASKVNVPNVTIQINASGFDDRLGRRTLRRTRLRQSGGFGAAKPARIAKNLFVGFAGRR